MTSSATQTTDDSRWAPPGPLIFGGLALAGWGLILYVNNWYLGVPAVMLCLGWAALLAVGRFLWQTGVAAWTEGERPDDEGFDVTVTRRDELVREKKVLLKALKELEFDHQMGKLSMADAESIRQLYRGRAIEIIKQLEALDDAGPRDGEAESIKQEIERELALRLSVAEATAAATAAAAAKANKKAKDKDPEKEPEAESDS